MNASVPKTPPSPTSLAARLRGAQVGVRDDLEVTRHLFRGQPAYVVRDPITFASQRFEPADYELLVRIRAHQPLGEVFDGMCAAGKADPGDEERFYQFVMELHRLSFLRLPIADDKVLYRRHQAKEMAHRRARWGSVLFYRVPLWDPNAFLDRTIQWARPLFTWSACLLWAALMAAAGYVLWARHADLREPMQGLLATQNLALMWFTLVVLKTFHEFGHAFACKHFGGHVPEMGAYFILFTPCAYVDATASWGFPRTRDRVMVCLAGMYIESIFAAIAAIVWASTGPSLAHSIAYNVIFLAGVVTILFNVNPLMRYDGYYVLSDLLGIPNLRNRASAFVLAVCKRLLLGVRVAELEPGWKLRATLLAFGGAAAIYRVLLLFAIAAVLASKMFLVGVVFATLYLAKTIFSFARRFMDYLWHAEETAPVRAHAVAMGVLILVVLPAAAVFVPLPSRVCARGVIGAKVETAVYTRQAGFVEDVVAAAGSEVRPGDELLRQRNDTLDESVAKVTADLQAARIRRDAFLAREPHRAMQEEQRMTAMQSALAGSLRKQDELRVSAPVGGRLVHVFRSDQVGSFLPEGFPVATIASGGWRVQVVLDEEDFARTRPHVGDSVVFRPGSRPDREILGRVALVQPAGSRTVLLAPLTQIGGGNITVNPSTSEAAQPYFEISIDLMASPDLRRGVTGSVQLSGAPEPISTRFARRITRFVAKLTRE